MENRILADRLQPAVHVPTFARVSHRIAREKGALARQLCRRVPEAAAYAERVDLQWASPSSHGTQRGT